MLENTVVVGIGPGCPSQLTQAAREQIEKSEVLIGAPRMLKTFVRPGVEIHEITGGYDRVVDLISAHEGKKISILAAGDVGFYSIAGYLRGKTEHPLKLIPGISSLQYFCARVGETWQDMALISVHGRDTNIIGTVLKNSKTFVVLGNQPTAAMVCALLANRGLGHLRVTIAERLSYDDERITRGSAEELKNKDFDSLTVMLVYNDNRVDLWQTPGIPDDLFVRGDVPMTKEPIRVASISKLRLNPWHTVYDIGAGTGSVAVECALQVRHGKVFAIERNPAACDLIKINSERFNCIQNLETILAEAPDGMDTLPPPDRVFIGGGGGNLEEILDLCLLKNPHCRIVINAILLESASDAIRALKDRGIAGVDVTQIFAATAKMVGPGTMMLGQNPVYIISAGGS
ncbi:MAG: precorrin-6y C5,15-methyltransferase (decarboxylating) subunit CbiE [Bacillota bacterium]|nr:precorrin-6y C5,15-methyltransferase (decarboxylating) subunit CbiE [Bacillota bacterium]